MFLDIYTLSALSEFNLILSVEKWFNCTLQIRTGKLCGKFERLFVSKVEIIFWILSELKLNFLSSFLKLNYLYQKSFIYIFS